MCILAFAKNVVPEYPLILIGNRDEFFHRPTKPAYWWKNGILAGQDLEAGGTWLGISKKGKFATLTNYRDIPGIKTNARSRGELPVDFLIGNVTGEAYLNNLSKNAGAYNGFNLLTWKKGTMLHFSNQENSINEITDGIHVLSNALLDTPWYKTNQLKSSFENLLNKNPTTEQYFDILRNESKAPDSQLPQTGLSYEMEKAISSICIRTSDYGTCCSTVLLVNKQNEVTFTERLFPVGDRKASTTTFKFNLEL